MNATQVVKLCVSKKTEKGVAQLLLRERSMSNKEKYAQAFIEAFQVEADALEGLKYMDIPAWDSVGHMGLIAQLEDAFDIMIDTDDIIELNSFEKGMEILSNNYDVEF